MTDTALSRVWGRINIENDALVVVDVQKDFCPGGALAVAGGDEIVGPINLVARRFRNVILTQDWHPAGHVSFASTHGKPEYSVIDVDYGQQRMWPDHCVQDTDGAALHPRLDVPHARLVIRKGGYVDVDSYSAFLEADRRHRTGLASYLREIGVSRVFVVGLALDFCVSWTATDAAEAGFTTVVFEDLTRGIDVDGSVAAAREAMGKAGVSVTTSGDFLFRRSGVPASGRPGAEKTEDGHGA